MTFTDDLRGLSWAEQIARIQAAARGYGDELDEAQAGQALSLYTTLAAGTDERVAALEAALHRHQHKLTDSFGEVCAGCLSDWPCPDLAARPPDQIEAGT